MKSFVCGFRSAAKNSWSTGLRFRFVSVVLAASVGLLVHDATAQSVRDAVEAAWARSVPGRSADARAVESKAKLDAAERWFAESPAVGLAQRTDRFNQNVGSRESEIELALPIRTLGVRGADVSVATSERGATEAGVLAAKWRLAGEVREALWGHHLAAVEVALAKQRMNDADTLARDVERRVVAGESARIDANRANNERDAAMMAFSEAQVRARQAASAFTLLTGMVPANAAREPSAESMPATGRTSEISASHPLVAAQRAIAAVANARRQYAVSSNRDPLELTIGTVRERDGFGDAFKGSARIGIRIPLPTTSRNAPRIAEADAARIEADAALQLLIEQVEAEVNAAVVSLEQVTALVPVAERRAAAARDTAALLAKSYQLGEVDLPTRLRADAERFDAERVAERMKLERARAISRLNQAKGLLP